MASNHLIRLGFPGFKVTTIALASQLSPASEGVYHVRYHKMTRHNPLHNEYLNSTPLLSRLQRVMVEQLEYVVGECGLTLGVPIESRVKTWSSISEKLERKGLAPTSLSEISDLVGIRIIFLFQRDLDIFHMTLGRTFELLSAEDTSERLSDAQFGYKSRHYMINLPNAWEGIPSFNGLTGQRVEVQVRTLAQHIWATASHKLQYKHEDSVPPPIRRSIYRVSALLETVDLELARVLDDRDKYVQAQAAFGAADKRLDVTILESVLDEILPANNKDSELEEYSDLLVDLQRFGVESRAQLRSLLTEYLEPILLADAAEVRSRHESGGGYDDDDTEHSGERVINRLSRGVFFTHIGLARQALCEKFGDEEVRQWHMELKDDA